jgi:hypothetical protein
MCPDRRSLPDGLEGMRLRGSTVLYETSRAIKDWKKCIFSNSSPVKMIAASQPKNMVSANSFRITATCLSKKHASEAG